MAQISPGDGAPGAAALQGIQDYADKLPGKSRTPHEPAPHTALARALNSLAKPPDCCARRAVEGDGGLCHNISGANLLAFDACLRVSACCRPVMEACFPGGKQSKEELVVCLQHA